MILGLISLWWELLVDRSMMRSGGKNFWLPCQIVGVSAPEFSGEIESNLLILRFICLVGKTAVCLSIFLLMLKLLRNQLLFLIFADWLTEFKVSTLREEESFLLQVSLGDASLFRADTVKFTSSQIYINSCITCNARALLFSLCLLVEDFYCCCDY